MVCGFSIENARNVQNPVIDRKTKRNEYICTFRDVYTISKVYTSLAPYISI